MKNLIAALLAIIPLLAIGKDFTEIHDKPYKDIHPRCVFDIYYPTDAQANLPVVIWFHGGGLTGGDKQIPRELKTGEYVVVAPSYRLLPGVPVEECIDDAAAVTSWVLDSIANYGGNPREVFVSGHSAGGYLASMIGLDRKWLEKYGKDADGLAALIPFSGQVVTHYNHRDMHGIPPLQPTIDDTAPLFHVRGDSAPYIIISGDRELELYGRYEENAYMWRMMKLAGHPYVYIYELDGYDHGAMVHPGFHIMKHHIKKILNK